ncbi:hypothetical protein HYZ41_03425 [archaeon]|nr:hypothetical protein [archaeon]
MPSNIKIKNMEAMLGEVIKKGTKEVKKIVEENLEGLYYDEWKENLRFK